MYVRKRGGGLGQVNPTVYSGPQIQGESGGGCVEGYFRTGWREATPPPTQMVWVNSPLGFVSYRAVGWLQEEILVDGAGQPGPFLTYLVIREIRTVDIQNEGQASQTIQEVFTPDAAGRTFLADPYYVQKYFKVCGPAFTGPDGKPQLIVDSWQHVQPPSERPPDPISIVGVLSSARIPGVMQAFPKVGPRLVSTSIRWPSAVANDFAKLWNGGDLKPGAEIEITGYPAEVRGYPGIIPLEFRVITQGDPDAIPDPWQVPLPEAPPDPLDPDPVRDEYDPLDPDDPENQPPPGDDTQPPPWNGNGDGNGDGDGDGDGTGGPLFAGLGGKAGIIVLSMLLLPLFFGKDKKK